MTKSLLAIDQGTTSSRAIRFSLDDAPLPVAQQDFPQIYPQPGWVEHNAEAVWASTMSVMRQIFGSDPPAAISIKKLAREDRHLGPGDGRTDP